MMNEKKWKKYCSRRKTAFLVESMWLIAVGWRDSRTTRPNFTNFTSGFVDDVMVYALAVRRVYSQAAIEHDNHNSRDSNQILLNDKDRKYSLWIAHQGDVCCLWLPCYIRQVNGVKLVDILFSLLCVCRCVCVSVRERLYVFRCKYLKNGLR